MDIENLAEVFSALGNEKRLSIALLLKEKACLAVGDIGNKLSISQATVSQHLRILRMAGIVKGEREEHNICYSIINKDVLNMLDKCIK